MADQDMLTAFNNCIDSLAAGNSVDDCVRHYPRFAPALRPMLEAGQLLPRAQFSPAEIQESQDRVRFRVVQALSSRRERTRSPIRRLMPLVASLILIFILALGATSILAESSLPGDTLYGMKRLTENIRLLFTSNRDALEPQFNQRRIGEIEQLLAQQREAVVEFEGTVEAINSTEWLVAGLRLHISPETILHASLQVGSVVEVSAATMQNGQIVAVSIRKISGEPITPPVPPTGVSSHTPTLSPSPTLSQTPTLTQTATLEPPPRMPTSETACVPTQPQGWLVYSVQPNDSLSGIATSTGTTLEVLMRVNCLTDRNLIVTGQRLYVPTLPITRETQESPVARGTEVENRGANGGNSGTGSSSSGPGSDDDRDDSSGSEGNDSGRGSGDG